MKKTIDMILNEEFKSSLFGYKKEEVDEFLDLIITEIEKLDKEHSLMLDEKKILEKNNFELKMKVLELEEVNKKFTANNSNLTHATKQVNLVSEQLHSATKPIKRVTTDDDVKTMIISDSQQTSQTKNINTSELQLGEAKTYDESYKDDITLQERIEALELELKNIKNFSDK